jgi:hypothetical protein
LTSTKREQIQLQQEAIEAERTIWRKKLFALEQELTKEKMEKKAQEKWRQKFLPTLSSDTIRTNSTGNNLIDPANEVFALFAQNVALLEAKYAPKVTKAGALPFLAHLLRENLNDNVTGSALLALTHLAIYQKEHVFLEFSSTNTNTIATNPNGMLDSFKSPRTFGGILNVKEEIVKAGAIAPMVCILENVKNVKVLAEAARLFAALGTLASNKRVIAGKNAVRFLIRLLLPLIAQQDHQEQSDVIPESARLDAPLEGDLEVQCHALSALVNLSYNSEILRSQIVNFGFLPFAIRYIKESKCFEIKKEASKLLGNLAYNHIVNQSAIMTVEGDGALSKLLTLENACQRPELIRACAIGIGNLAFTSVNQLSIGYGESMTCLLRILVENQVPETLEACLNALTSLCHQNPLNKNRASSQNGLKILLFLLNEPKRYANDLRVVIATGHCFSILARTKHSRQEVLEMNGHVPILNLCKSLLNEKALEAIGMALAALVPTKKERQEYLLDGKELKLHTNGCGIAAFERIKHLVYGKYEKLFPSWLTKAIKKLNTKIFFTQQELEKIHHQQQQQLLKQQKKSNSNSNKVDILMEKNK